MLEAKRAGPGKKPKQELEAKSWTGNVERLSPPNFLKGLSKEVTLVKDMKNYDFTGHIGSAEGDRRDNTGYIQNP